MSETPQLRWSVHVDSVTQPEMGGPNYGSGDTPDEALADLERKWSEGLERYDAAINALKQAKFEAMSP